MCSPRRADFACPALCVGGHRGVGDVGDVDAREEGEAQSCRGAHEGHAVALVGAFGHIYDDELGYLLERRSSSLNEVRRGRRGGTGSMCFSACLLTPRVAFAASSTDSP